MWGEEICESAPCGVPASFATCAFVSEASSAIKVFKELELQDVFPARVFFQIDVFAWSPSDAAIAPYCEEVSDI